MVQVLKEEIRQKLLDVGFKHFKAFGYRKTKISAIAKESGISASTVYSYFDSKSELLNQIFMVWMRDVLEKELCDSLMNIESKEERLRVFLRFLWVDIPKAENYFLLNFFEALSEANAKELERQRELESFDEQEFAQFFKILTADVFNEEEAEGLGHLLRFASMGFLVNYQIDDSEEKVNKAIESFILLLKRTQL